MLKSMPNKIQESNEKSTSLCILKKITNVFNRRIKLYDENVGAKTY